MNRTAALSLRVAAVIAIAAGAVALTGWHIGELTLARWGGSFVTLKYNASISAILIGVGLWMSAGRSRRFAWLAAVIPALVALLTLVEYGTGVSLGIDQIIAPVPDVAVPGIPLVPGRMAPNAAVSFFLASVAVWQISGETRIAAAVAAHVSVILVAIGGVALAGYALGLPPVATWGPFTPMALPASTITMALGVGLGTWAWQTVRDAGTAPWWLPVPTAIGVFAAMVIVLQALVAGDLTLLSTIDEPGVMPIVTGLGLVASLALAVAVALVQHARAQTAKLHASNATLRAAIVARDRAAEDLRVSERRFHLAFDSSATGMALIDPGLTVVEVNPALCEMLQYRADEIVGRTMGEFTVAADAAADEALLRQLVSGEVAQVRLEKRYRRRDGEIFWALVTRAVARDESGEPRYIIAHVDDIHARKMAEERLAKQAAALAASNAELEQFAYVASHDLQEPLRMVSSYTQLLARRYHGKLGADADEFIGYAVDGARRMQTLIEDLLSYSRVGRRGEPEVVDLNAVAAVVQRTFARAIAESHATVSVAPLPTVRAVPFEMEQVLQNLLSNALKFHGADPPRVEVSAEPDGADWQIRVRDHGIGLDPQYAQRIFFMFQRLHGRDVYPGNGIGLALCKKIVERHGGRIGVESTPGDGATFWFTIPKRGEHGA